MGAPGKGTDLVAAAGGIAAGSSLEVEQQEIVIPPLGETIARAEARYAATDDEDAGFQRLSRRREAAAPKPVTDAGRRAHQLPGHGTALAATRQPLARQQVSAHQPGAGQAERGGPQSEELLAADPGHGEGRPENIIASAAKQSNPSGGSKLDCFAAPTMTAGKIEAECLINEVIAPLLVEIAHQRLVIEALDGGGDMGHVGRELEHRLHGRQIKEAQPLGQAVRRAIG